MAANPHSEPPLPLRLATESEEEAPTFLDLVYSKAGRAAGARLAALLQEWDVATDDWQAQGGRGEPTIEYYADRFNMSRATASRDMALFRRVFPSERTPRRILSLLWDARRDSCGMWLSARVVEL